jgi:RNA polymerase sigma-70 factor (ECF subfamily)
VGLGAFNGTAPPAVHRVVRGESAVATDVDGDERLVERARSGDERARDALVSRHHGSVYAVALRVLGDPDEAADAAQEAFIKALGALDGFRGDASFRTWLLRIAANTATSVGRKRTRRREVALAPAERLAGPGSPERDAVLRTEAERVEAALARLPEKQRLAVTLRLHEELTHREIAEVLDSTEGAVRVNYHLGIKRLREWLT